MVNKQNADELVVQAKHDSVTKKRLTKLKGGITARYLYDKPLIEYFNQGEQPHFILVARNTAPNFSGQTPSSLSDGSPDGMAMHMITDERWIIVVGMKDSDEVFEIPLEKILEVDYSTGTLKHKISLLTTDDEVEIPIANSHNSDDIEDAVEYIRDFESSQSSASDSDANDSEHQTLKELRETGIGTQQLAAEMVDRAKDDSVTRTVLTTLERDGFGKPDYLRDAPLIEYLDADEQPHIIVSCGVPPDFVGSFSVDWSGTKGYSTLFVATNKRLLLVQGHKDGDMSLGIPYDEIKSAEVLEKSIQTGFRISTDDGDIELEPMSTHPDTDTQPLIEFIREKADIQEDEEGDVIIDCTGSGIQAGELYAKLIVPTKSSGATFASKGWNVGGDIVRRTTSKGEIKENPWENYVTKLAIHEDYLEIQVTFKDSVKHPTDQTLRIDLNDITDIRQERVEAKHGFVFETAGDVYQFKLSNGGPMNPADKNDAKTTAYRLREAVENAPAEEDTTEEAMSEKDDSDDDAMEKLSKLKELHEQGVLTDEEFQNKKEEILDKI